MPAATHSEASYLLCTEFLGFINHQLDNCAETEDPWEARYKFDAIKPFVQTLQEQIETLEDEAERDTCRQQMEGIIAKGRRIAPDIPLVCQQCYDVFNPGSDAGDKAICPVCQREKDGSE